MANETTTSVQSALIASQVIRDQVIQANRPRMFVLGLMAHDTMDGEGSNTVRYAVYADLGAASAGSEGVDLQPTVSLSMASSVELSPTEAVADMSLITEDTVMRRLGGTPFRSVRDVFSSMDQMAIARLLGPDITRQTLRAIQKLEADALSVVLNAPSTSKGTTNTALSVLTMLATIRQMKINQPLRPPSEWVFLQPSAQVQDLQNEAIGTSGGAGGSLWMIPAKADQGMVNRPADDWQTVGRTGTFLQFEAYEYDDELKQTANGTTDVLGIMLCKGDPTRTPNDYAGKVPSFVYVERSPIAFAFQPDASLRSMEVIDNARYVIGEMVDLNHVGILSKNS